MPPEAKYIRASMLPGWNDCPRRAASKQYRKAIEKSGYTLRDLMPSIGAAVGTAVHHTVESWITAQMSGEVGSIHRHIEAAVQGLLEEVAPGCEWDDTTPTPETARIQIERMAKVYIADVGESLDPIAMESSMCAALSERWSVSGTLDMVAQYPGGGLWLRDIKTGAVSRSHHAQLGAYSLLLRSQEADEGVGFGKVVLATIDFIKRVPRRSVQPGVVSTDYDVALCERSAWNTIQRVTEAVDKFIETQSPDVFAENPLSLMCSPKFCAAHGTDFCPVSKGANIASA